MLMEPQPNHAAVSAPSRWQARLHLEHFTGAAREFLRWWRMQLSPLVPPRLAQLLREQRLRAEASTDEVCVYRHDGDALLDRVLLLGPLPTSPGIVPELAATAGASRCDVLLDAALVLESPVTLPIEAARELRRVLAFSMDRYTPFEADEVYFDFRVVRRDVRQRKVDVILYAVARSTVDNIVSRLAAAGLVAVTVDVAAPDGGRLGINLLPTLPHHAGRMTGHLNAALVVLAVVLLLAVLAVPLWHRQQAVAQLEQELAQLVPEVQAVERLQATVDAQRARVAQIQQRKATTPAVLEVLLELTRLVPDEAWAGQVEWRNGRLKLTGEAEAASALMQTLTASGYFADPRFEAPLTQNPKSERERFVISLTVKGHDAAR